LRIKDVYTIELIYPLCTRVWSMQSVYP